MRILLTILCCIALLTVNAQIYNPKEIAKRKAQDRTNSTIDRTIDKGLDKVEEGIGNIFKKKDKSAKEDKKESKSSSKKKESNTDESEDSDINQESDTASKPSGTSTSSSKSTPNPSKTDEPKTNLKTYSKFDFVAGEKIIGMEEFTETSVGDFPLGWNTNASAEIVTLGDSQQKWLFMSQDGFFQPDFVKDMPDNFTLEYDIFTRYASNNILNYNFNIYASENPRKDFAEAYFQNGIYFNWTGGTPNAGFIIYENGEEFNKNENLTVKSLDCGGENNEEASKVHFAIWRQKNRLRVYVNELKVLDLPQAFNPKFKYNAFKLGSNKMNYVTSDNKDEYMVANVRYAVGAPDTRSKLITEGKLVTRGILFDVNSDKIKAESYGVLKEIGTVLKENPTVKVKIIGHTDSDGDDAKNLDLSKRRAASVKNALSTEFGIPATQMETDGKGETQPSDPNTTPQGKANNRRVEFVKL